MAKFCYKTAKDLLLISVRKEAEYERFRVSLFDKAIETMKDINMKVEVKPRNIKISLIRKNLKVNFYAKRPFKLVYREAFDDEGSDYINDESEYQVSISKNNDKMVFDFFSDSSKIYIRNIAVVKGDQFNPGRHFSTLDEKTQEEFTKYLQSKNLSPYISNFVDTYSIERNDELYLEWLGNIENFLKD